MSGRGRPVTHSPSASLTLYPLFLSVTLPLCPWVYIPGSPLCLPHFFCFSVCLHPSVFYVFPVLLTFFF